MALKNAYFACIALLLAGLAGGALAQDELRQTFLKDAEEALAEADAANAKLLAPKNYREGMEDFEAAGQGLEKGRNIEYVRD
jgi:predicted outer membrane protein